MRAMWNGSVSFGLVNIPIRLYGAAEERALSFKTFDRRSMCPVSYKKICRDTGKDIDARDIVKGFELEKGKFVTLEPEDFKRANARKTETIDIVQFSNLDEIDSKYYDHPYYLEPEPRASKAYALLRDALKKSKQAGIARYVLRDKEKIGALVVEKDALMLIQLRFQNEIRDPSELHIPGKGEYSKQEFNMALALVKELEAKFDPSKFRDTFTDELMKVIRAKAKGKLKEIPIKSPIQPTDVEDILAALKRSLEEEPVAVGKSRSRR